MYKEWQTPNLFHRNGTIFLRASRNARSFLPVTDLSNDIAVELIFVLLFVVLLYYSESSLERDDIEVVMSEEESEDEFESSNRSDR